MIKSNLKIFLSSRENKFLTAYIFIFVILHSVISLFHFHECDSSDVYKYLTESSIFSRGNFIGHIWKTGSIFFPLRTLLGLIASIIPVAFIRNFILLPLKMTYPPLEGLMYGLYLPDGFGRFYEYASLINIFLIVFGLLIFYKSLRYLGISIYVAFIFSFGILNFYSINSYTYHLGSTIWFVFGSLISISSTIFYNKKFSKYGFTLALLSSYPSLIHIFSYNLYLYFYQIKIKNIFSKKFKKKEILDKLFFIVNTNKLIFITSLVIVCLFFPFNSGDRVDFDVRGLFTPFSLLPIYSEVDIISYIVSTTFFLLSFYTIYKRFNNSLKLGLSNQKYISLKYAIDITLINLLFIVFLIMISQLSLGITRHSIFILPYFSFLAAIGLQFLLNDLVSIYSKISSIIKLFFITLFIASFTCSLYSSYLRFDPLKTNEIPKNIREFASKNNNKVVSLLDCDTHFLYNDFTELRATYNKKDPNTYVPLNFIGERLLISQSIMKIKNFKMNLKKGDVLITKDNDVKIVLAEDPYFIENQIYFYPMNFDKNSNEYQNRDNTYSRSNSVYIFPIKVTNSN